MFGTYLLGAILVSGVNWNESGDFAGGADKGDGERGDGDEEFIKCESTSFWLESLK